MQQEQQNPTLDGTADEVAGVCVCLSYFIFFFGGGGVVRVENIFNQPNKHPRFSCC